MSNDEILSPIIENEYHVVTVVDLMDSRGEKSLGYSVLNKSTGVIEHECFNFIECAGFVKEMHKRLTEYYGEQDVSKLN